MRPDPVASSAAPGASLRAIVYDGGCSFCRARVAWIQSKAPAGTFVYISRSEPDLLARFPQLASHELAAGLRLVLPDGTVRVGADAVADIAALLPRYRWLTKLLLIPGARWVMRGLYACIAAIRSRL